MFKTGFVHNSQNLRTVHMYVNWRIEYCYIFTLQIEYYAAINLKNHSCLQQHGKTSHYNTSKRGQTQRYIMNDFICLKYKRWQNHCVKTQGTAYLGKNKSLVIHSGVEKTGHTLSSDLRCESLSEKTPWWSIELLIFASLSVFFIRKSFFFFLSNAAGNWVCSRNWGIHTHRTSWKKLLNVSWIHTSSPRLNFHWQCHIQL